MSPLYVNETTGSDETGTGTQDAPFKSLAQAVYANAGSTEEDAYLVATLKEGKVEFVKPTQSALKKAKKGADGIEKKKKKAEELAERAAGAEKEERERREKALEESKKIVLEEDEGLPQATKVHDLCLDLTRFWLIIDLAVLVKNHSSGTAAL
jgi:asparaginyl-tRNA synthetase